MAVVDKYYTWQYNGRAPWSEILLWCTRTFSSEEWAENFETFYFVNKKDYEFFLLRWS